MFWVYVLINRTAGKRYIGQTDDLDRRMAEHNGQSENVRRYTSKYQGKWELVYSEQHSTRSKAMAREKWLKGTTGRRWINKHMGRAGPSALLPD